MSHNDWLLNTKLGALELTNENKRKIYILGLQLFIKEEFKSFQEYGVVNFNLNMSYSNNVFNRKLIYHLTEFIKDWNSNIDALTSKDIEDIVNNSTPFNGDVTDENGHKYHFIVVSRDDSQAITIKR